MPRKISSRAYAAMLALCVSACATHEGADITTPIGPAPSMAQAQSATLAYLETILKDPRSLKDFRIVSGPTWFSWYRGDANNGSHQEAWLICFEYNAKNGSGAYTGLALDGIAVRVGADNKPHVVEPVNWALASSQCGA